MDIKDFNDEIDINLRASGHDNIIKIIDHFAEDMTIVTELAENGTLNDYIFQKWQKRGEKVPEDFIITTMIQIC